MTTLRILILAVVPFLGSTAGCAVEGEEPIDDMVLVSEEDSDKDDGLVLQGWACETRCQCWYGGLMLTRDGEYAACSGAEARAEALSDRACADLICPPDDGLIGLEAARALPAWTDCDRTEQLSCQ